MCANCVFVEYSTAAANVYRGSGLLCRIKLRNDRLIAPDSRRTPSPAADLIPTTIRTLRKLGSRAKPACEFGTAHQHPFLSIRLMIRNPVLVIIVRVLVTSGALLVSTSGVFGQEIAPPNRTTTPVAPQRSTDDDAGAPEDTAVISTAEIDEYYELMKLFVDTIDEVERNYVRPISRRELMEAAIEGVLSKLDNYSDYIAPDDVELFKQDMESEFGGIGIQVATQDRNGPIVILSPLVGTPAYRAGLKSGDLILEIDGTPTKGVKLEDSIKLMKGRIGTPVELKLQRTDGSTEIVSVKRDIVRIETVVSHYRRSDDQWEFMFDTGQKIGYIRVTAFSRHTIDDLTKALQELTERGLKGLVLDLRFNPGGLLEAAIEVSDLFVSSGRIVSTKGRNIKERIWEASAEGAFEDFPMVILVNRYSASASEIVSACLQDQGRATIIGTRTWGKGSVQRVIDLEEGRSALKITTASYVRPNGNNIHRFPGNTEDDEWGVKPNEGMETKLNPEEMQKLLDYHARISRLSNSRNSKNLYVDRQLQKGLDVLRSKLSQ